MGFRSHAVYRGESCILITALSIGDAQQFINSNYCLPDDRVIAWETAS